MEGSPSAEEGEEVEKEVLPKCGEIFNQSRYKVTMRAFVAQKLAQVVEEEKETSAVELRGEDEPRIGNDPSHRIKEG